MAEAAETDRKDTQVQWYYQSNPNPWSEEEIFLFTAYKRDISAAIEEAYQNNQGITEIRINKIDYRIDTGKFLQISVIDDFHQRRIRRCSSEKSPITTNEHRCRQRFGCEQNIEEASPTNDSITDTGYYGSKFIQDWYSSHCKKKVSLFDSLLQGIVHEGELKGQFCTAQCYANELLLLRKKEKSNHKIRHKLEEFCAYLYTTNSFIHGLVNQTLRNYDRGRLETLGPFCYLLYNYNGSKNSSNLSSTVHRMMKIFSHQSPSEELAVPSQPRRKSSSSSKNLTVYRGEQISSDSLLLYKEYAGVNKYFRWTAFSSTSKDQTVAEIFASQNVLFIIEIPFISFEHTQHNDQYVDLSSILCMRDEQEVLLKPGFRFKVKEVKKSDETSKRYEITIEYVHSPVFQALNRNS